MMKKSVLFSCFCLVFYSSGQQLNTTVNKSEIAIGEPFTLTFSIVGIQQTDSLKYMRQSQLFKGEISEKEKNKISNSHYNLEILDEFKDTFYQKNKQLIWEGSYKLTGWDSAFVIIPPEPVVLADSVYFFPPDLIKINSPATNPTQPIYDIEEIFTEVKNDTLPFLHFVKKYGWIIPVFAVGAVLFILLKRRKKNIELNLKEDTLQKLELLEKSKIYEHDMKEYYFSLSLILRKFLSIHYNTPLIDKTTRKTEKELLKNGLDKNLVRTINKLLLQSDMVKFAQSKPSLNDALTAMDNTKKIVVIITEQSKNDE